MSTPALDALRSAYASDEFIEPAGRPVIGYVGRDTPVELLTAAGAEPLRLRAPHGLDTARADELLGNGVDPAIRGILAGILAGSYGELAALVVSSDCDASQRLFYVLRELKRRGVAPDVAPVWLIDILHSRSASVAAYNETRLAEAIAFLDGAGTHVVTPDRLAGAIGRHAAVRSLLRDVLQLRRETPARLSGADALAVIGASTRLPLDEAERMLHALLDEAPGLAPLSGIRVYMSGSAHDSSEVYQAIESRGAVVVGEDHEWGEIAADHDASGSRLDDLAVFYRDNGPSSQRASIAARAAYAASGARRAQADVVVTYAREKDDAPLWDASTVVSAMALPSYRLTEQAYRRIDDDAIAGLSRLVAEVGS